MKSNLAPDDMNAAAEFTPEILCAMANAWLNKSEQWIPPRGTKLDGFIYTESHPLLLDMRKFKDADEFEKFFGAAMVILKADLRTALAASDFASTHKEVGFQTSAYPADEHGEHAVDLGTNQFTHAVGVGLRMRLFAKEIAR